MKRKMISRKILYINIVVILIIILGGLFVFQIMGNVQPVVEVENSDTSGTVGIIIDEQPSLEGSSATTGQVTLTIVDEKEK